MCKTIEDYAVRPGVIAQRVDLDRAKNELDQVVAFA